MRNSNWSFLHLVAILEEDLFQITLHPGPELHRIDRLGVAGEFQVIGHRLAHRLADGNLGGRRRGVDVPFAAGQDGQQSPARTTQPATLHLKSIGLAAVISRNSTKLKL